MSYYKKYLGYFFSKLSGKIRWGYSIFFITNRCNSKCKHCFYWKNLNKKTNELSLNEIEKITKKLGIIRVLLLSGGEPFLRDDLFEVITKFIQNNKVKVVSIPTNAILTKQIIEIVERLSDSFPKTTFSINPSIDNLFEKNDEFRGVKGGFKNSIKTLKELIKLKEKKKNIEVVINTTISNQNYNDFDKIIDFFKNYNLTYHNFELLRGNPMGKSINIPPFKEIQRIHKKALESREYYIKRNNKSKINLLLEKVIVLGVMKYIQKIKENVITTNRLPFICSAGKNIFVMEPEGEIRLCELLPKIGNLRDYNYDIERLLENEESKKRFKQIKKCCCTHVCFINMSVANNLKSIFKILYHYLK